MSVYDKIWTQERPRQIYLTSISRQVMKLFKQIKAERVLDIGAGDGANLIFLAKNGYKAYGFDVSREGVKKAKETAKREKCRINVLVADMFKPLPYKNEFFDAVYSYQTMNHGRHDQIIKIFEEIYRVLKPGGIFSIKVAERSSFKPTKVKKDIYYEKSPERKFRFIEENTYVPMQGEEKGLVHYYFSKEQLKKDVCKAGFKFINQQEAGYHIIQNYKKK
jgi:SAM-dependent methyltransferase